MSKRKATLWMITLVIGAISIAACTRTLATPPIALADWQVSEDQELHTATQVELSDQEQSKPTPGTPANTVVEAPTVVTVDETQPTPEPENRAKETTVPAVETDLAVPVVETAVAPAEIGAPHSVAQEIELPATYRLRTGEFPYCIARRFNIDPLQIMELNHLSFEQLFYPGDILKLPHKSRAFPGERALHPHPDRYTVQPGDTIYSVACYYGDMDPKVLARANGIKPPFVLSAGQVLKVPAKGVKEETSPAASASEEVAAQAPQPVATEAPASPATQPPAEATPLPTPEPTQEIATPVPVTPEIATATPTLPPQPDLMDTPPPALPVNRRGEYVALAAQIAFNPADVIDADPADAVRNGKEFYDLFTTQRIGDPCATITTQVIVYVPQQLELNQDIYFKMCNWPEDDPTRLALAFPDGQVFSPEQIDRTTYLFTSLPSDPAGEYRVMLYNPLTKAITGTVPLQIRQPSGPRVARYSTTDFITSGSLFLYSFAPGEQVNIEVFKIVGANANEVVPIGVVVTTVDDRGQLQVVINEFALNALQYKYRIVGLQNGEAMYIVPEFIQ